MSLLYATTRWLVTAGLIFSLVLTGFSPDAAVTVESSAPVATSQPSAKCCCGTDDGRCCGTACCVVRQPPAKRSTSGTKSQGSQDGPNNPLALAWANASFAEQREPAGLRFGHLDGAANRSLAEATLQGQHVRIDV